MRIEIQFKRYITMIPNVNGNSTPTINDSQSRDIAKIIKRKRVLCGNSYLRKFIVGKHIQVVDWQKRHMKLSQYFALDVF